MITTSLASVAVACGIDGMLAKLEKGTANPSLGVLGKITSGLRIEFQLSNRRLSQVISADYLRRKHLSHSAVNDADAHYIGANRRLSRAYFSSAMAGLK